MISVIVPCYNDERFVAEAILSVINQTYTSWELIIVDDGSTDKSLAIIKQFESDARIRVIEQSHAGGCAARNKGLSAAHGEYVKFLDADDVLCADCLERQLQQLQHLKPNQIPFGDYDYIGVDGDKTHPFQFDMQRELYADQEYFFFIHWIVLITAPLHRRAFLMEIGGFDEQLARGQESDLHWRLALNGVEFIYCPLCTFGYRQHSSAYRITNCSNNRVIDMEAYWNYRMNKCERLLLAKYGQVPKKYQINFADYWFSLARTCFSLRKKKQGIAPLKRAHSYEAQTFFMRVYYFSGRCLGYVRLERILQLRLKVLGKK